MRRPIGILGGMGPQATIDLMARVLARVEARTDADHVPLVVHQNTQVPSRISALIDGDGADPGPVLAAMARDLERAGVVALAMPCNTAHHYAPRIAAATCLPLLDMVERAVAHGAVLSGNGRIGILGSPALQKVGVYDAAAADQGVGIAHLRDTTSAVNLIKRIKATGVTSGARTELTGLARDLEDQGVGAICVACTEFSLLTGALAEPGVPVFDALDVLSDAIIAASATTPVAAPNRIAEFPRGSARSKDESSDPINTGRLSTCL